MDENWWPKTFEYLENLNSETSDYVTAGEYEANSYNYHKVTLALVDPVQLPLLKPMELGYDIETSTPDPSILDSNDQYTPQFRIWSKNSALKLEPLVITWESSNRFVFLLEQGFMMTYGLVPRLLSKSEEMIWDEPETPTNDVVIMKPTSTFVWGNAPKTNIRVRKAFLQDYSTIRKRAIIQLYDGDSVTQSDSEFESILEKTAHREFQFKNRVVRLARSIENKIHVETFGFRILFQPGDSPITRGRWDYGELVWPGYDEPITRETALRSKLTDYVYVRDHVLAQYEGKDGFSIYPESGSVHYGNQWAVIANRRVGKDTIEIELKKMYEGVRPDVVRYWHSFATAPLQDTKTQENIAQLAKELVHSFVKMGNHLSRLISLILKRRVTAYELIKLDDSTLSYYGWWSIPFVEPITRHIPKNFNRDSFLSRCNELDKVLIENLNEKFLRRALLTIGIDSNDIKDLKSIKLLDLLIDLLVIAHTTGLDLLSNSDEIRNRYDENSKRKRLSTFVSLNTLRRLAAHRANKSFAEEFSDAILSFGIDPYSLTSSYREAIEQVYKKLNETIMEIYRIITDSLSGS